MKKTLKKIVPATYGKIESSQKKLSGDIDKKIEKRDHELEKNLTDKIEHLKEESYKKQNRMQEETTNHCRDILSLVKDIIWKLNHNFPLIHKKLDGLQTSLEQMKHKYLYNNNYERKVIESFYEMYEREDFKEKFLKLVYGLENEDVAEIVKILQRQRLIKDTMNEKIDLFSKEEQELILETDRELKKEVFRVADDLYCYKHYFLPINHFESSVFVFKHGIDCIENSEAFREKDILDVGGYIGDSILILKNLTNRRVISFEAVSDNFRLMQKTVELNRLDNVILEHMALGKKKETMTMTLAGASSAFHTNGVVTTAGAKTVQVNTLDEYLEGKDIDVGLIKVDIEGAEQDFMEGAKKTIAKFKPVLLMSIYHNADDFFSIKPIIESWDLGYKFHIHKPVDYSVSREVLLIAEVR